MAVFESEAGVALDWEPMKAMRLTGYAPDLDFVSLIQAIREHAGLTLAESKVWVERLIDGQASELAFETSDQCVRFMAVVRTLGVEVESIG